MFTVTLILPDSLIICEEERTTPLNWSSEGAPDLIPPKFRDRRRGIKAVSGVLRAVAQKLICIAVEGIGSWENS